MSEYLDVIVVLAILWSLAGLKWWFFDKNPKEWKDTMAQWVMGIFFVALVVTVYIQQSNKTYHPYKGRDYEYYAREAAIKKQIEDSLRNDAEVKKPARRLNEELYQEDIPIQELMRQFRGGDTFL